MSSKYAVWGEGALGELLLALLMIGAPIVVAVAIMFSAEPQKYAVHCGGEIYHNMIVVTKSDGYIVCIDSGGARHTFSTPYQIHPEPPMAEEE